MVEQNPNISKESSELVDPVNILNNIANADWFRQVRGNVVIYDRNNENELRPTKIKFSIENYLQAVDYYYQNRDSEIGVSLAMREKDGVVNVYGGEKDSRKIVVRIPNYRVPEILEFAYLLLRSRESKK